jgi:exopolysaccharide production protein ExoY
MRKVQTQAVYEYPLSAFEGDSIASEGIFSSDFLLFKANPVDSWRYHYVKRGLDVLCALILIAFFAIPGLLIAAVILLTSEGSAFYREVRLGSIAGAEQGGKVLQWRMRKHLKDPRITAIGGILRRWSLDELPQLFNVLSGEMSLVGPRPIVEAETGFYGNLLPFYLAATPGLSGLWQVSGRSNVDYAKRAKLDAMYVRSWCLESDLSILFRTIPAVLTRIGAR